MVMVTERLVILRTSKTLGTKTLPTAGGRTIAKSNSRRGIANDNLFLKPHKGMPKEIRRSRDLRRANGLLERRLIEKLVSGWE
jgi:hypothetical protein